MTEVEFIHIFADLEKAYGRSHTPGEIQSYWGELKAYWPEDFRVAANRLPANEPPNAYRPFPTANTIRNYILDAQEARRWREQHQQARSLEDAMHRSLSHIERHPSEQAFVHMVIAFILHGLRTPEARQQRRDLIEAFLREHQEWLATHAGTKAWLEATREECVPQESRA